MDDHPTCYPVALNLKGRKVVILGGGEEAARKAQSLLSTGAQLTAISPAAGETLRQLARTGKVTLLERAYCDGDFEGAVMAFAVDGDCAGGARVEATRRGVLLNVLDRPEMCDFIAPATLSRGGLQLSIHSSGRSAALTRRVRERLETQFGEEYAELASMLGQLRPVVRGLIPSTDQRHRFWLEMVSQELLDRVEAGVAAEELRTEIVNAARDFGRKVVARGEEK